MNNCETKSEKPHEASSNQNENKELEETPGNQRTATFNENYTDNDDLLLMSPQEATEKLNTQNENTQEVCELYVPEENDEFLKIQDERKITDAKALIDRNQNILRF